MSKSAEVEVKRVKEIWASSQMQHPKIPNRYVTDHFRVCRFTTEAHATLVIEAVIKFDNAFKVVVQTPRDQETIVEYNGEPADFCACHPEFVLPSEPAKSINIGTGAGKATLVEESFDPTGDNWRVLICWPGTGICFAQGTFYDPEGAGTYRAELSEKAKAAGRTLDSSQDGWTAWARCEAHAKELHKVTHARANGKMGDWFLVMTRNPKTAENFAFNAAGKIAPGCVVAIDPQKDIHKWMTIEAAPVVAPTEEPAPAAE